MVFRSTGSPGRGLETRAFAWVCGFLLVLATANLVAATVPQSTPPTPAKLDAAIHRGLQFLLQHQNRDGSWGSARRTKDLNIYAPVPGAHHAFRSAVTALAVEALIECDAPTKEPKARAALERGETWLLQHLPKLRRANPTAIYNVWGHAYGIQALVAMYRRATGNAERQQQIKAVIQSQIDLLQRYETVNGGWAYYDFEVGAKRPAGSSISFVTAAVLVAWHEARSIGADLPTNVIRRAVDSLQRQRKPDNSYLYGEYLKWRPMRGINRPAGSLGRSQACNLALRLWGDTTITPKTFATWLDRLVARDGWLSIGRKRPVPHESWFQVAGYFYYYGHYYAARCIDQTDPAKARHYRDALAGILLPLQEKDGSWWDFPFYDYHQPYGTAYALMSLVRCRQPAK